MIIVALGCRWLTELNDVARNAVHLAGLGLFRVPASSKRITPATRCLARIHRRDATARVRPEVGGEETRLLGWMPQIWSVAGCGNQGMGISDGPQDQRGTRPGANWQQERYGA